MFTTFLLFLTAHWGTILAFIAAIHTLAVLITNLTPTPADDAAVAGIYRVIEVIAGLIHPNAKLPPAVPEVAKVIPKVISKVTEATAGTTHADLLIAALARAKSR